MCLALVALVAFQAHAELWLIGAVSPDGWNPSKGVQFTKVDDNNYTLDLQVNVKPLKQALPTVRKHVSLAFHLS